MLEMSSVLLLWWERLQKWRIKNPEIETSWNKSSGLIKEIEQDCLEYSVLIIVGPAPGISGQLSWCWLWLQVDKPQALLVEMKALNILLSKFRQTRTNSSHCDQITLMSANWFPLWHRVATHATKKPSKFYSTTFSPASYVIDLSMIINDCF
jgi:hypothetical protein